MLTKTWWFLTVTSLGGGRTYDHRQAVVQPNVQAVTMSLVSASIGRRCCLLTNPAPSRDLSRLHRDLAGLTEPVGLRLPQANLDRGQIQALQFPT